MIYLRLNLWVWKIKSLKILSVFFLNVYANSGIESIAKKIVVIGFTKNRK